MREARNTPGVKRVLVSSGVRMDLATRSPAYLRELARHHVGGQLKVAPEHTNPEVLRLMRKPGIDDFERFAERFRDESRKAGKRQHLVPYYIASHPGSDLEAMIELAEFLKKNGYRPDQVQDFIPAPMDVATAMYYTGMDPFTKKPVPVARSLSDRRLQRALLQFFKPENYFAVRKALLKAGRRVLIGPGCHCLIPTNPPAEALLKRRKEAVARLLADTAPASAESRRTSNSGIRRSRQKPGPGYRPDTGKARRARRKRS
jgi:radical SAM superfamily enzyme YgiQ (UPF0313 family)